MTTCQESLKVENHILDKARGETAAGAQFKTLESSHDIGKHILVLEKRTGVKRRGGAYRHV
jgi:hypothetical protein